MADPALTRPRLVLGLGLASLCGFVALSWEIVLARTSGAREVRDDNMVPEWRTPWWNWFLR